MHAVWLSSIEYYFKYMFTNQSEYFVIVYIT